MHTEVLRKSSNLLVWLAKRQRLHPTCFPASHLDILWHAVVTSCKKKKKKKKKKNFYIR